MELLESEVKAKSFVLKVSRERALSVLDKVCSRIQRRIERANKDMIVKYIDDSCVRKADWEVELIYQLKLGLMLTDNNSAQAARERIIARRLKQKELRLAANKKPAFYLIQEQFN